VTDDCFGTREEMIERYKALLDEVARLREIVEKADFHIAATIELLTTEYWKSEPLRELIVKNSLALREAALAAREANPC
jgi:hypothetical protein